jgi:hypothetical protein
MINGRLSQAGIQRAPEARTPGPDWLDTGQKLNGAWVEVTPGLVYSAALAVVEKVPRDEVADVLDALGIRDELKAASLGQLFEMLRQVG